METGAKKRDRYLGLGCLGAGAVFLFDPFVSVFDFLPDWIGYLLILHGLSRLAYLDGHVEEACRQFRRLLILSVARFVTIPLIFGLTAATEQGVELLLCTFSLAVLDIFVLIPAWRELGQGMSLLAALHEGTAALVSPSRSNRETSRSVTDRMVSMTLTFMCLKEVLAVLPELSVLFSTLGGAEAGGLWSGVYQYIGISRGICAFLALVLGIVWLYRMLGYVRRLKGDTAFFESLRTLYGAYIQRHPWLYTKRIVRRAMLWLSVGLFLTVDFYVDGINILPDALVAVCFLIAMGMLRHLTDGTKPVVIGLAVYIPISLISTAWQSYIMRDLAISGGANFTFLENAARMARDPDSMKQFYLMCAVLFTAQLIFAGVLCGLYRVLCGVVDRYTGLPVIDARDTYVASVQTALKKKILAVTVFGVACEVFSVIYILTLPQALNTAMELFGFLDIVLHIVFGVLYVWVMGQIREQIEYKYMLS